MVNAFITTDAWCEHGRSGFPAALVLAACRLYHGLIKGLYRTLLRSAANQPPLAFAAYNYLIYIGGLALGIHLGQESLSAALLLLSFLGGLGALRWILSCRRELSAILNISLLRSPAISPRR